MTFCLLKSLFESIKNEQFKIPEDDGNDITRTFFNPDREGWLTKEGKIWSPGALIQDVILLK